MLTCRRECVRCCACVSRRTRGSGLTILRTCAWRSTARSRLSLRRRRRRPRRQRHADGWSGWPRSLLQCLRALRLPFPQCGICAKRRQPHRPRRASRSSRPPRTGPRTFALSPDGRQIVFVASGDGASRLWLRSLATTTAQPLAGTEGATFPFWSPDSRSIGFFAGGALKRLDLVAGAAAPRQTLAPALNGSGAGRGTRTASSCLRRALTAP